MKLFVSSLLLVAGLTTQAQANTVLTDVQKAVVNEAITQACGYMRNLTEVSTSVEVVKVDQFQDLYYTTVLTGERRLDQNLFDSYVVTVSSSLTAGYDHVNKTSGVFSVQNVNCVPQ